MIHNMILVGRMRCEGHYSAKFAARRTLLAHGWTHCVSQIPPVIAYSVVLGNFYYFKTSEWLFCTYDTIFNSDTNWIWQGDNPKQLIKSLFERKPTYPFFLMNLGHSVSGHSSFTVRISLNDEKHHLDSKYDDLRCDESDSYHSVNACSGAIWHMSRVSPC